MERWEEWAGKCYIAEKLRYIPEWIAFKTKNGERRNENNAKPTRNPGTLQTAETYRKSHEVETWISQDYTEQDIDMALRRLANNRQMGATGIPGESYMETRKWKVSNNTNRE